MGFRWPTFLLLLLFTPGLIAVYLWILNHRKKGSLKYSSISILQDVIQNQSQWRRHVPFALLLLTFTSLTFALARPFASINVPSSRSTILLAFDVSLSMCSTDIAPNRFTVAQQAAETFIRAQGSGTNIGIVAFSGFAELIIPPTNDKAILLDAVDRLTVGRRTAIGSAILRSIDAIAEFNPDVPPANVYMTPREVEATPIPDNQLKPDIIVLLTDGASNRGVDPLDAAQAAADRGIRVYTLGYGTPRGSTFRCTEEQLAGFEFGDGFGQGFLSGGFGPGGFRRGLDEETLQEVSEITEAEYYLAESADQLLEVFTKIPSHLTSIRTYAEISALFNILGVLFVVNAFVFASRWSPLP